MLRDELVRNALLAGTPIALASGAVGWFAVLRSEVFAGDALGHVAFTGALAAAAAGLDLRLGVVAAALAAALLLAALGGRARPDDTVVGAVFVLVLGLGVLCLDLVEQRGGSAAVAARALFGSIFGLGAGEARLAAAAGLGVLAGVLAIARPLLYATVAPEAAALRGVPVALLGAAFLALLGIDAAAATQAVGALLLLGLVAAPAGAALALTARPFLGLALSCLIAAASLWLGVAAAYAFPAVPPSSAVVGAATLAYVSATAVARRRAAGRVRSARRGGAPAPAR